MSSSAPLLSDANGNWSRYITSTLSIPLVSRFGANF
jgi:hypothetical protein